MRQTQISMKCSASNCKVTAWKKKRKMNALQLSWWVIFGSLLNVLAHVWVVSHILDQIQNRYTYHIYSHLLSHRMKMKTRPHRLGVRQKFWWKSRPPQYSYRKMVILITWIIEVLIFVAALYTSKHLIHVKIKCLPLHLRTAKGRPIVREINSVLFSLLVIT